MEKGADVNLKDDEHHTPLHLSSEEGHNDVVKTLIEAGANVDVKNLVSIIHRNFNVK